MKHIPNIITCLNLFAGCLACIMALRFEHYTGALFFILLAAVFDFLDGFAARMLKAYSSLGAQLDSLADVVSFGVAPACIVYSFLFDITDQLPMALGISIFPFLIAVFSALRLAKFNIDTRQTDSFLGLPVPANGLFWASLIPALISISEGNEVLLSVVILGLVVVFSLLMVSEIPMFSLKFKHYKWKGNEFSYLLIVCAIVLVLFFKVLGISLTIAIYILLSLFKNIISPKPQ